MSESIKLTYNVPGDDFTRAGEASSDVKGVLKKLGLSPAVVRKVAIAMYEGEINMVIHGGGGQIAVEIGSEDIRMSLSDHGPGIPDIALAMQEAGPPRPRRFAILGSARGWDFPT